MEYQKDQTVYLLKYGHTAKYVSSAIVNNQLVHLVVIDDGQHEEQVISVKEDELQADPIWIPEEGQRVRIRQDALLFKGVSNNEDAAYNHRQRRDIGVISCAGVYKDNYPPYWGWEILFEPQWITKVEYIDLELVNEHGNGAA